MNAYQFIKEHGVEKAREVVEGAPELAEYYSTIDGEYYRIEINAVNLKQLKRLVESVDSQIAIKFIKEWGDDYSKKYIALSESEGNILPWELSLKRLVESVDLVKSYGGIINAKHDVKYLDLDWDYDTPRVTRLRQAIADYEQLFGNTETSELKTLRNCDTSPNCKKFNERVK